jgi:hypothetical protein
MTTRDNRAMLNRGAALEMMQCGCCRRNARSALLFSPADASAGVLSDLIDPPARFMPCHKINEAPREAKHWALAESQNRHSHGLATSTRDAKRDACGRADKT